MICRQEGTGADRRVFVESLFDFEGLDAALGRLLPRELTLFEWLERNKERLRRCTRRVS